ncbi:folylpolyglutamate synthase [Aureococcus anophagefferens]|nr:folylpolyglutamate synthase [Aureococcus anophagefferens]
MAAPGPRSPACDAFPDGPAAYLVGMMPELGAARLLRDARYDRATVLDDLEREAKQFGSRLWYALGLLPALVASLFLFLPEMAQDMLFCEAMDSLPPLSTLLLMNSPHEDGDADDDDDKGTSTSAVVVAFVIVFMVFSLVAAISVVRYLDEVAEKEAVEVKRALERASSSFLHRSSSSLKGGDDEGIVVDDFDEKPPFEVAFERALPAPPPPIPHVAGSDDNADCDVLLPDFLFRFAENAPPPPGETDDDAAKRAIVDFCTRHGMASRCMVDKLLAPPKIPVADLGLAQEDRAAARHAFQRRVFDDAFAGRRTPRPRRARAEAWGCVFFDRLLAAALLHFGAEGCGVLVLEAGIGGLYDSTNFFGAEDLELAVITSISLDHTTMLGSTLAEIAGHKAGVMRRGVTALTPATQHPDVLRALRERAAAVGRTSGRSYAVTARDQRPDAAVLVCGSVYVAAEAREWAADRDPACLPADDWARVLRD